MTNNKKKIKTKKIIKKKPCVLCQQGVIHVDYKNAELLSNYISYNGKILPKRITGCCAKHQRMIANAIKRARIVALLPFIKD